MATNVLRDTARAMSQENVNWRGQGAGSDIPWDETVWQVARWRRGKCVWWRSFETRDAALEAVGPSE